MLDARCAGLEGGSLPKLPKTTKGKVLPRINCVS
jgi:hypothetical protein